MAPHFSKNWNEWTSDDLIELAFYLQLSEVCSEFEGTVTSRSVKAWLEDLGRVFGLEWQSTIEEDSGGSDYQSSIGFGQDIGDSDYQSSIGFGQDIGDSDLQSLTDEQHSGISSSGSSTSEESLEEIEDLRWLSAFVDPTSLFG
ncbi:MAG: hypothetical protein M1840_006351 [Geoglossum simile]|nr:MAG: hypothetical protein M1840_006351 [Geoglossum simile]